MPTPPPPPELLTWVKGTAGWRQSPVGDMRLNDKVPEEDEELVPSEQLDGQALVPSTCDLDSKLVPLSDQAAVDKEADTWAVLWQETARYEHPSFPGDCEAMEELMPDAIVAAAGSFPVGTGLGADNISPRAFGRLSMQALTALAVLFSAFEAVGSWCATLNLVLIVLLP